MKSYKGKRNLSEYENLQGTIIRNKTTGTKATLAARDMGGYMIRKEVPYDRTSKGLEFLPFSEMDEWEVVEYKWR